MYLFFSICLCFIDADAQTLSSCLLRLLGLQVFLLLVKLAAHGTCVLGLQIKGFVLLTFVEFPEVPFLVDDCEDTGTDLPTTRTLESLEAPPPVTWGHAAGTAPPQLFQLARQLLLLLAENVWSLNLGHFCKICRCQRKAAEGKGQLIFYDGSKA